MLEKAWSLFPCSTSPPWQRDRPRHPGPEGDGRRGGRGGATRATADCGWRSITACPVASSAPAVLIAHLANATTTLRVGSGGVMLPNHAPLVVAEQFGTLEALHPGRIDLGLGRAPGTDQVTVRALRRTPDMQADTFPDDVVELINYLLPGEGPPGHPFANPGPRLPARGVAARLVAVQRATGGDAGASLLLRLPLCPQAARCRAEAYRSNFRPSVLHAEPQGHGGRVRAVRAERVRSPLAVGLDRAEHPAAADGPPGPAAPRPRRRRGIRSPLPRGRSSKRPCPHI